MKGSIIFMILVGLIFFSCEKSSSTAVLHSIEGTWKMIIVRDIATDSHMIKPITVPGDVILSFDPIDSTKGVFSGNTPTNSFGPDFYSLTDPQNISIPVMNMTKVAETSWGQLFVDNIREASSYSFSEGNLNIQTAGKILIFQRV